MTEILEVAELDFALEPFDWGFARERAADIAANWAKRRASQPKLFDGRVLLNSHYEFTSRADGRLALRGAFFETAYSNFLSWRDFGSPDASVLNGFSMAALRSADGAFLLGEMSAHTANAGQIYFAAGTPDLTDVFDGKVDLLASVKRELEEETGVAASEATLDPDWIVVRAPPMLACMKVFRSPLTAEALQARIHAFLASERDSELARVHIARTTQDLDGLRATHFVREFIEYASAAASR